MISKMLKQGMLLQYFPSLYIRYKVLELSERFIFIL